ncbi:hypothetical protein FACS1894166_04280 [Bacilli bacterium]|nr:hypothetical protein FACS1894166_04280 [Bacilli bacterium]
MKMYFIKVSEQLSEEEQGTITEVLMKNGGIIVEGNLMINDKSFLIALKQLETTVYNIASESKSSKNVMLIHKANTVPPPDRYVTHHELKVILKDELTPFVTKDELKVILRDELKPFVTKDELKVILKDELKPFVTKDELKVILKEELTSFVTKDELKVILKEELTSFVTNDELKVILNDELKPYVTKADLKEALEPIHKALNDILNILNSHTKLFQEHGWLKYQ